MCVCVYTSLYIYCIYTLYIHTYIHIYIYIYICIYMCVCVSVFIYGFTYLFIHLCIYICICVCVYRGRGGGLRFTSLLVICVPAGAGRARRDGGLTRDGSSG